MRKNVLVIFFILLVIMLVAGYFIIYPEQSQLALVELGLAEPEQESYLASGMLEADVYNLSFENGGRIAVVLVEEGQLVTKGQTLATQDDTWLALQLDAANAQYDAAEAVLALLETGASQEDLNTAKALVAQAEVVLEAAERALEDVIALENDPLQDEQEAIAQAQVEAAEAGVAASQAVLVAVRTGPTTGQVEAAKAGLSAAESQVAILKSKQEKLNILAPVDGIVLEILQEPGEIAAPGWAILKLADLSLLQLTVFVPEADLNWVAIDQVVSIRVDAFPDKTFAGWVTAIADQAEFTPRNVQTPEERTVLVYAVKIQVPNAEEILKPGLPADAEFEELP